MLLHRVRDGDVIGYGLNWNVLEGRRTLLLLVLMWLGPVFYYSIGFRFCRRPWRVHWRNHRVCRRCKPHLAEWCDRHAHRSLAFRAGTR
jgi:hypothetical protein